MSRSPRPASLGEPGRPPPRHTLHIVSGKGGTGKTTIAAALACALATARSPGAALRGRGPPRHRRAVRRCRDLVGAEERADQPYAGGGACYGLAIDAEDALLEYLDTFYHLGFAGEGAGPVRGGRLRHLDRPRAARRAAHRQGVRGGPAAARRAGRTRTTPWSWTPRRPAGSPSSSTCTRPCPGWPRWARSAARPTRSCGCCARATTVVHLVTLLEDMPVTETEEAVAARCGRPTSGSAR